MTANDTAPERTTEHDSTEADNTEVDSSDDPLPEPVVDEAERLTRLARQVGSEDEQEAYRAQRDETLADHEYTARLREDDETLVLYPNEWLDDGTVRLERVEDTDRAVEIPLSATAGDDEWAEIEAYNAALVEAIADEDGDLHAKNARAFADFMGNHYLTRIDEATADQLREFITEYYPRNAWATTDQQAAIDASLEKLFAAADTECPTMPTDVEN